MTQPLEHPVRGALWNEHGLSVCTESRLNVVSDSKINELQHRNIDPHSRAVIIPILGTAEINSNAWKALKRSLESGIIKFLVEMKDAMDMLEDSGEYFSLESEELAEKVAPFGQTDLLVQECVNLSPEYREGLVKLVEPRSGFKDRAVALSYANMIADKIENKYSRTSQKEKFDMSKIQLVW